MARVASPAARALAAAGVKQADLAGALGKSQQAVSMYLSGKRTLPSGFRTTLAKLSSSRKAHSVISAIPSA